MTSVWSIHMSESDPRAPVRDRFAGIGWNEMGDLSALHPDREAFKARFSDCYPEQKPGAVPVKAGVLYRFAHEMRIGDLIVYPSKPDRMIYIGRIAGPYRFTPGADYAHQRAVDWTSEPRPRASFSQSALNEIGALLSLIQVNNNPEEFIAAHEGRPFAPDDVDDESAAEVSEQVEENTEDFIIKRLKTEISDKQFEHFVAHLMTCMGYHARVMAPRGGSDGGYDVIAHRDELGFEPPVIKVECKQRLDPIGREMVQKLDGAKGENFGLFVTLGGYKETAKAEVAHKPRMRLIDGDELAQLVKTHYDRLSPKWRAIIPLRRAWLPDAAKRG